MAVGARESAWTSLQLFSVWLCQERRFLASRGVPGIRDKLGEEKTEKKVG